MPWMTREIRTGAGVVGCASMRPRLIAVDDERCFEVGRGLDGASMRPRLIAVDDADARAVSVHATEASMRPRLIAVDDSVR